MAKRAIDHPKIDIQWNRVLDEVLGNDTDGVTAVRLKSTAGKDDLELEATGVFLSIGHTPNTAFLDGALELTEKKYVKWTTPGRTYTSVEGVFAAGDVGDDYYRQAVTAAGRRRFPWLSRFRVGTRETRFPGERPPENARGTPRQARLFQKRGTRESQLRQGTKNKV